MDVRSPGTDLVVSGSQRIPQLAERHGNRNPTKPVAWDNSGRGLTVGKCDEPIGRLKFQSRFSFCKASYFLILLIQV